MLTCLLYDDPPCEEPAAACLHDMPPWTARQWYASRKAAVRRMIDWGPGWAAVELPIVVAGNLLVGGAGSFIPPWWGVPILGRLGDAIWAPAVLELEWLPWNRKPARKGRSRAIAV
jgi:hypothetical protein